MADGCDPVTLEIVKGALISARGEMEALIERTAMSDVIREKKDFFAGYFDPAGHLVTGTPLPLFGHIMQPIIAQYPLETMQPGDLYWYNDCYATDGGVSHLNDQVFASPVFHDGRIVGFSQSWAHFHDIGGAWPGSMSPTATEVFQEGLMVPPVRLYRAGVLNDELFRIFLRNSRFPLLLQGDTRALTAAVRLGERRLQELAERFGAETLLDAYRRLAEQTEAVVRKRLRAAFPAGTHAFADVIETDGQGNGPFKIRLRMDVGERIVFDATATDDQAPGPVNWIMNRAVPRMIFGIFFSGDEQDLMINEGTMRAIDEVTLREGSLLRPRFPAPLCQRGLTMARMVNMCAGLVNVANGGNANAGGSSYCIWALRGRHPGSDETFLINDGVAVGFGARPYADGHDAVYFVAQENNPAEYLDQLYPARLLRYAIHRDSGGPGRWRGGCGVVREIEWLGPDALLANRLDGTIAAPWGVKGGMCGRSGGVTVNPGRPGERRLPPLGDNTLVRRGDVIRIETTGGGGWGHPHDREAERVLADVLGDFVSRTSARDDYGVVLNAAGDAVDAAATAALRGQRPPAGMFHRDVYLDAMQ